MQVQHPLGIQQLHAFGDESRLTLGHKAGLLQQPDKPNHTDSKFEAGQLMFFTTRAFSRAVRVQSSGKFKLGSKELFLAFLSPRYNALALRLIVLTPTKDTATIMTTIALLSSTSSKMCQHTGATIITVTCQYPQSPCSSPSHAGCCRSWQRAWSPS